ELARLCGAADEARALFEESVALCRSLGSPAFLELSLGSLARLARDSAPALGVDVDTAAAEKRGSHREGPDPHVSIERTGDLWAVEGPSQRRFHLKHSKGLAYLSALVASPGHDIHVLALLGIEHRGGDGGPVLDAQARAEYRRRLSALDDEIDEAEKYGDVERARRARAQVESLGAELSRAVGLFGRERRTSSDVERARINVQRRIKDAIDAIERADPGLARYLRATIATGTFCSFTPV
ncbi:MAG TPA: hypothetical protein VFQ35_09525, partial [Polyangiaceae bacterium]|nr:hypothetical protein [Polyangiaceae bacterium]